MAAWLQNFKYVINKSIVSAIQICVITAFGEVPRKLLIFRFCFIVHLNARDTSRVLISLAPYEKLAAYKKRMGWTHPWYSSHGTGFNRDFDVTRESGEMFGINVFIRDGEKIYRSYCTTQRGAEYLGSNFTCLDLTPMGRQESWEESPAWVPQTPPYQWWYKRDEYPEV